VTRFVVDASVAAKWLFKEVHSDPALMLLDDRNELHAPDLFLMEVDSVVCKRVRRKEIGVLEGRKVRAALRRFPVQTRSFVPLLDPAYEISVRTGSSLYNCVYLALGMLLKGPVVTADRRLYEGLARSPYAGSVLWIEDVV
jgi:predicted nucleic acid-binding protein